MSDCTALRAVYSGLGATSLYKDVCCTSLGTVCDLEGNVLAIQLSNKQLGGILPSAIGQLKRLQTLELENNRLNGPIPNVSLPSIRSLLLKGNALTGSLPASWSVNLDSCSLASNLCVLPGNKMSPKCGVVQVCDVQDQGAVQTVVRTTIVTSTVQQETPTASFVGFVPQETNPPQQGLSTPAATGIAVGALFLVFLFLLMLLVFRKRNYRNSYNVAAWKYEHRQPESVWSPDYEIAHDLPTGQSLAPFQTHSLSRLDPNHSISRVDLTIPTMPEPMFKTENLTLDRRQERPLIETSVPPTSGKSTAQLLDEIVDVAEASSNTMTSTDYRLSIDSRRPYEPESDPMRSLEDFYGRLADKIALSQVLLVQRLLRKRRITLLVLTKLNDAHLVELGIEDPNIRRAVLECTRGDYFS
ncbi:hypothetical protein EDD86DRAFT_200582 [Gorgonomyces haynaldii]|nr:hypothetical protein EDD86DRAFT_200582 [Gorgonomyces haynaldii]